MTSDHSNLVTLTSLQQYDLKVLLRRDSSYMDYPAHVHMETFSHCNAACYFCPYPQLERKGTVMPDELVEKIVGDLTDIPRERSFQLSPFKVNEPFLDLRIFEILSLINEKLPNARLTLTTNATPLTEAKLEKVRNLGYLWISVNEHCAEMYERTMGLPFERTMDRFQMIHDRKASGGLPMRIVLSRVGDGSGVDQEFERWVQRKFPLFEAFIFQRGAWIGQVDVDVGEVPNVGCMRWFDISIVSNGVVAHCCMDGGAKWPIGDAKTQHVLEIYNSLEYRKLRERTVSRLHVEPCNRCTFL